MLISMNIYVEVCLQMSRHVHVIQLHSILVSIPEADIDGASRIRQLEQSVHFRRGLLYAGIVILLIVASCLYFAIPILRDPDTPYLQEKHWISYCKILQISTHARASKRAYVRQHS